jgi:hypothetical protein
VNTSFAVHKSLQCCRHDACSLSVLSAVCITTSRVVLHHEQQQMVTVQIQQQAAHSQTVAVAAVLAVRYSVSQYVIYANALQRLYITLYLYYV